MEPKYNAVLDVQTTEIGGDSLTLAEAKGWLKIDVNDDDALLTTIISAARVAIENYVNLSLSTKNITAYINNGLGNFILPFGPVMSIASVTDLKGIAQVYTTQGNVINECFDDSSVVTYIGGYSSLPANLRIAWLQQCAYMYEHRGDEMAGDLSQIIRTNLKAIRRV